MERLMHETRETTLALLVVTCLAAGIGGAAFYTFGPDGWLVSMIGSLLENPTGAGLGALVAVVAAFALAKRWLDRDMESTLNNLLVGVVALGGLAILLQGARSLW